MNYSEARRYIAACYKKGSNYELEAVSALVAELKFPQRGQNIIHIAGTNGKGSVGAFIESILINAGFAVGRFASPSVYSYDERFLLNGKPIGKDDFADVMTDIRAAADNIPYEPTGFELETAAALVYFKKKNCDFSIVECGLGGRTDATNIIDNNLLTVFTSISLDHTALLGDTVAKITAEKCGIIRPSSTVVSIEQSKETEQVILSFASCTFAKKTDILNYRCEGFSQSFDYKSFENIKINMAGSFQCENAALAVECVLALRAKGFFIPQKSVYDGLVAAHWDGRFDVISRSPIFVVDGAHNPDAAIRLKNSIESYFKGKRLIFIIGVFADKDYNGILSVTAPLADKIFAVQAPPPRGLDRALLVSEIKKYNKNVAECDLEQAVKYCLEQSDSVTVAFGSLSLIGEITRLVRELKEQNYG